MKMFIITEKPAFLHLETQIFDELQLIQVSSSVPDFVLVNSMWYNLRKRALSFLTKKTYLQFF